MKIAGLLTVMVVAVCLVGCENAELVTCQQEKTVLQGQLDQANNQIEALKAENVEMQTKAMESITTMMQKQAKKDEELKKNLADAKAELKNVKDQLAGKDQKIQELAGKVADLEKQISEHKCPVPEAAPEATATPME